MKNLRTLLFFTLCMLMARLGAQDMVTLSGYVKAASSGEGLIGATVAAPSLKMGTYTNEYGFFTFNLPKGNDSVRVRFSFAGFQSVNKSILPTQDINLETIELEDVSLDAVVIEAEGFQEQLNSTQMSVERLTMTDAKKIPALFGEVDIIKTLQLKPGVSNGSEGSSGIFVRGGSADQNLVLLDNTLVYNPSHLFGFFSTFNSDAVKDVKLYKGGFPAQYGGRLSSVIDVKMNEGNAKKISGSGGLGLIASRLTLEGPIVKDKASFMISGRRTYADIITRGINRSQADNPDFNLIPDYFFYDFNAKANYIVNDKNQIFISGYFGRDKFTFDDDDFNFNFFWGNANGTLRWNHLFTPRLFMNVSASVSDYRYSISNEFDIFNFELGSQITDQALSTDFSWIPNDKHTVRFGAKAIRHHFVVGRFNAGAQDSSFNFNAGQDYFGTELGAYIADEIKLTKNIKINAGLRLSGFASDSTFYPNIEPRVAANFKLSEQVALKASYARMAQYLHLVANSGSSLPTDIWYPSNRNVRPQQSDQVASGITYTPNEDWIFTTEVYYKWLHNQIDFRDAADLFVNDDLDQEFVFGRGWAYGAEFYVEKKHGKFTGWVGYTLAWSYREFDGTWRNGTYIPTDAINEGRPFFVRNDKRHDVSIVGIYDINKRFSVSASWEYRSGNAITLALGRFASFGSDFEIPQIVPVFQDRNSFRMPAYHKGDVGFVWRFFPKWGEADLTISAYNAYNRRNPYFIYFENVVNEDGIPTAYKAQQVALFPVIPSITYNFKF
ncbi:MAG: TonB-dependent receptor [Bacteroidota bacterium]